MIYAVYRFGTAFVVSGSFLKLIVNSSVDSTCKILLFAT